MTAMSPLIHFALKLADGLDAACDEMPEPACTDARITLSGFARALQITAEQLKAEEAAREARLLKILRVQMVLFVGFVIGGIYVATVMELVMVSPAAAHALLSQIGLWHG